MFGLSRQQLFFSKSQNCATIYEFVVLFQKSLLHRLRAAPVDVWPARFEITGTVSESQWLFVSESEVSILQFQMLLTSRG